VRVKTQSWLRNKYSNNLNSKGLNSIKLPDLLTSLLMGSKVKSELVSSDQSWKKLWRKALRK
jgi:hypothetical protein